MNPEVLHSPNLCQIECFKYLLFLYGRIQTYDIQQVSSEALLIDKSIRDVRDCFSDSHCFKFWTDYSWKETATHTRTHTTSHTHTQFLPYFWKIKYLVYIDN